MTIAKDIFILSINGKLLKEDQERVFSAVNSLVLCKCLEKTYWAQRVHHNVCGTVSKRKMGLGYKIRKIPPSNKIQNI